MVGIRLQNVKNVTIRNARFHNVETPFDIDQSSDVTI